MAVFLEEPFKDDARGLGLGLTSILELLKGDNFREWALTMQMVLRQRGLVQFIEEPVPVISESWNEEKKLKFKSRQDAALATIYLGVHPSHRGLLDGLSDPMQAWTKLQNTFEPRSRAHIAALREEYLSIRFKEGESMALFVAKVENAVRRLKAAGKIIEEDEIAYHPISHLPKDYEGVVNTVYLWGDSDFTVEKVKAVLFAQYGRLQEREESETKAEGSAYVGNRGSQYRGRQSSRGRSSYSMQKCFRCNRPGHYARDCQEEAPRGESYASRRQNFPRARAGTNRRPSSRRGGFYVAAYLGSASDRKPRVETLTFDTAATHHIVTKREMFNEYKPLEGGKVRFGTQDVIAEGVGTVQIEIGPGQNFTLNKVLHVSQLDRNLLSWRALDNENFQGKLEKGKITLTGPNREKLTAHLTDKFYVVTVKIKGRDSHEMRERADPKGVACAVETRPASVEKERPTQKGTTKLMMWHRRFAHANCKTIEEMAMKELVRGLDVAGRQEKCEPCIYAKCHQKSHPRIGGVTTKGSLELVHSDIWGPAPVDTYGGGRYFITFIDDYTRETVVYVLKRKSEAFETFVDYMHRAERQTGRKLRRLRTDNGLEYCSRLFQNELRKLGIKHERTNIYNPSMNGVAERYNRTALESLRATLEDMKLPKPLWGEVLMANTYVKNRTKHSTTNEVPVTLWTGVKPSVKHLKRIGCTAYVFQPARYRNKFERRAKKGILIGYAIRTKGYRIWHPRENTVVESLHVSFDEEKRGIEDFPGREDVTQVSTEWVEDPYITDDSTGETEVRKMTSLQGQKATKGDSTFEDRGQKPTPSTTKQFATWRREAVPRRTGNKIDVYYYPSTGERLRSNNDVKKYCERHGIEYDPAAFNWKGKQSMNTVDSDTELTEEFEEANDELEAGAYRAEVILPVTFEEACTSRQSKEWKSAMSEELEMMEERDVWQEVQRPEDTRAFGTKWVYTIKKDDKEEIKRFKARLVVQGQHQQEGIDYMETYSPVVNFQIVRLFFIVLVVLMGWKTAQVDVKCAYLYGNIDQEMYLRIPKGYQTKHLETTHLKLQKALYGLHQSGRLWHGELHEKLLEAGFVPFLSTNCVYRWKNEAVIIVYVDDVIVFGKDTQTVNFIQDLLASCFDIKRLGEVSTYLGVAFHRQSNVIAMEQKRYIKECADRFGVNLEVKAHIPISPGGVPDMRDCPQTEGKEESAEDQKPYRELTGCLLFLAQRTRPDLTLAVSVLSQYCANPGPRHWRALQQILRYAYHTSDLAIQYKREKQGAGLTIYVDADWATSKDDRRSMSGYLIYLYRHLLSWRTVKQKSVAMSTMEAEFVALSEATKEVIWLTRILEECKSLGILPAIPVIYCDNQAALAYSKNQIENSRTRHIDVRYHFVKELVQQGKIEVRHVPTTINTADILTKALPRARFETLRGSMLTSFQV